MCKAKVRLSRRRTWHISCATIALNCSGVSRCKIPSGNNSTGRKIPKMPGSIGPGDESTGTSISKLSPMPLK